MKLSMQQVLEWIDDISELNKLSNYEKKSISQIYFKKAVKWLKS